MIIIGIVLFILGFGVFIIAWRGRIVARGAFCNACRFDLAGLDLKSPSAQCPECGCSIHQESARRPSIRRRSRLGLSLASIILLLSIAMVGVGALGKTNSIVSALPDSMVLMLSDMGVDAALDELVARASRMPTQLSAETWTELIETGLEIQADKSILWDVRWGEVLFQAIDQGHMSDDQVGRYIINGHRVDFTVRDKVHPGDDGFGYRSSHEMNRFNMITGGDTLYRFSPRVVSFGIVGQDPIWEQEPGYYGKMAVRLYPFDTGRGSLRTSTWMMKEYLNQTPGEEVDVYFDIETAVLPIDDDEFIFVDRVRKEFSIKILDPAQPIVPTYVDEAAAQKVIENLGMSPIRIRTTIQDPKPNYYTQVFRITFRCEVDLAPLALGVFLLIEGQEVELGNIENSRAKGSFAGTVSLGIPPENESAFEAARKIHAKLLRDQSATIIVRPRPEFAKELPELDRILEVKFIFEDVPIVIVETYTELNTPDWDGAQLKATLLDD